MTDDPSDEGEAREMEERARLFTEQRGAQVDEAYSTILHQQAEAVNLTFRSISAESFSLNLSQTIRSVSHVSAKQENFYHKYHHRRFNCFVYLFCQRKLPPCLYNCQYR
jgi:hypothetical protein